MLARWRVWKTVKNLLQGTDSQPEEVISSRLREYHQTVRQKFLLKSQPRRFYTTEDTTEQIDYIRGENRRAEIYLDFES